MLKFQLKLPEIKRPFSADETEEDVWTLALGLGPGEELATFRSNLLALDEENQRTLAVDDENEIFQLRSEASFCRRGSKEISDHICAELDDVGSAKAKELEFELSQKIINVGILRSIASSGLPDGGGLRAKTWKLLLGYLSPARDSWDQELAETRVRYAALKGELLLNPSEFTRKDQAVVSSEQEQENDLDGSLRRHQISHGDHPLSLGTASVWNQYFQDAGIVEQIDRDLQRTHPNMRFFSGDTSVGLENQEAMRNILFLFAKLNPAIRYVQGMNEVLAPLYYVLRSDPDEQNSSNAEADSFACFVRLLSDSVDHFCQQLDNSSVGILSTLSRLGELLKVNDEELWRHLEISTKVKAQFYAFRWITLLLTQEFHLRSIMRIWDSLISNPLGVQEMLLRVCCAMLLCVKDELLRGDFTANLKLLQHYPQIDVEYILQVAQELTPHSCCISLAHTTSLYGMFSGT